jgi:hypothetical protein
MELSIPQTAKCLACGYPLRGLSAPTCPECGQAFDPQDSATYEGSTMNVRHLFVLGLRIIGVWTIIYLIGNFFGLIYAITNLSTAAPGTTFPQSYLISQSVSVVAYGLFAWALIFRADWFASRAYSGILGFHPSFKLGTIEISDLYVLGIRMLGIYALVIGLSPATLFFTSSINGVPLSWGAWVPAVECLFYLAFASALIFWAKPIAARFDKSPGLTHPPAQSRPPPPNRSTTPTEN